MEQIVLANITTLRKMGTTNFFRLLKEKNIRGIVGLNAKGKYTKRLLFTTAIEQGNIPPSIDTITKFLSSEELHRFIKAEDKGCNGTVAKIKAELEKVDYRSKSTAALFNVKFIADPVEGPFTINPTDYEVIEFTEKLAKLDYEEMKEAISGFTAIERNIIPQPNLRLLSKSAPSYNLLRALFEFACKGIIEMCNLGGSFITYLQLEDTTEKVSSKDVILSGSKEYHDLCNQQIVTKDKRKCRNEAFISDPKLLPQGIIFKGKFYTVPIEEYKGTVLGSDYVAFNEEINTLPYDTVRSFILNGTRTTEEVQGF